LICDNRASLIELQALSITFHSKIDIAHKQASFDFIPNNKVFKAGPIVRFGIVKSYYVSWILYFPGSV
ncbi:MAG: hypothetical protein ACFFBS_09345, partial [Promethearchaeota archaeon]